MIILFFILQQSCKIHILLLKYVLWYSFNKDINLKFYDNERRFSRLDAKYNNKDRRGKKG